MGSYLNFKNFGEMPLPEGNGGKPASPFPLTRQSSIYSLTFDELQTYGGLGKDLGSMNMEDLLKNIWTAEESQAIASSASAADTSIPGGNLQRQGSLTLPRTLSQKTVDEVWRDFHKETENGSKNDENGVGVSNFGQRQSTLGEMTLEEFLVRAGVVREEIQPNGVGLSGGLSQLNSIGFQQPAQNPGGLSKQIAANDKNAVIPCASNLMLNAGCTQSSQQQQLQLPLFSKQTTVAFASPMQLGNNAQLASPRVGGGPIVGMSSPLNTSLAQGSVMQGGALSMAGLCNGATTVIGGSPRNPLSSDIITKSNLDTSSLSPSPFAFNEGGRGRKAGSSLEKVVERRRRRMIKNRESAARSRARKQAYTLELEEEVAKLKEINQELRKKQTELMEMQKNENEKVNMPWGGKSRCLRRTVTGPL
nr:ABSCISIC ACID-INSENSITIVE 5-like protein 7 [Ipomoea batatas]